jgi:UDP-glucose 4-epimerase
MAGSLLPPKTVLLTGGRGRLSSVIRHYCSGDALRIVPFSRTRGEGIHSLDDLLTPGLWEEAEVVAHAAWSTVPLLSERNPGVEWETDLPLLVRILRKLSGLPGPARPHFIFFSSGGTVYGDATGRPSREDDPLRPKGWHGLAKVQAENLVREFCTKAEIPFTILRIANPYGFAGAINRPQGIIPIIIQTLLEGRTFPLWGDGHAVKDFLHAADFATAFQATVERRATGTFNLSSGESHSVMEIVQKLEEQLKGKLKLAPEPAFPWDVVESRLDNQRIRKALGWSPAFTLDHGLEDCVAHARELFAR